MQNRKYYKTWHRLQMMTKLKATGNMHKNFCRCSDIRFLRYARGQMHRETDILKCIVPLESKLCDYNILHVVNCTVNYSGYTITHCQMLCPCTVQFVFSFWH